MPRLTLRPDSKNGHVWVTLGGQELVPLREGDGEGLRVITTCLVDGQAISAEEAAAVQGVTLRTVEAYRATYAETENSADLIDRRHFNPGQRTDYRMEPHKPELIRRATLNLVQGKKNSERGLAAQLDDVIDDRTVGRHLQEIARFRFDPTDVEELYQIKLNNLERETILERLMNQRGEFVRHETKRIILVVFDRFRDRRMQAAFERYCIVLNQRDIRVPMDDGEPWRLLSTYHLDAPSSSAQFK